MSAEISFSDPVFEPTLPLGREGLPYNLIIIPISGGNNSILTTAASHNPLDHIRASSRNESPAYTSEGDSLVLRPQPFIYLFIRPRKYIYCRSCFRIFTLTFKHMMQSAFNPNASERRWPGSAVQDAPCDYWPGPATSSSPSSSLYQSYYTDYPRSSNYPLPSLSPSSPCSSAASSKSPSADYIWSSAGLYVLDDDQHRHFSSSNPGDNDQDEMEHERHDTRVKSEPVDTSFIIEGPAPLVSHSAPPPTTTACPSLRATHATKDMKKMMGVFRLDPFIFKGGSWQQEENTGLKEEPEYLQFYLDFNLENVFEQCMWSPQPEEHIDRTYREEVAVKEPASPYSNQPTTYAYEGE